MKNFVQCGDTITLTAPYAVSSGGGFLVGSIFAIATADAANGAAVEGVTEGVFDHAKTDSQAWTVGQLIYWDNTNKVMTNVSTSNKLIGVAVLAVASTAGLVIGRVRLNGAFIS